MATVKAFIRAGKKNKDATIRFRISDGRDVQLFHKSKLTINPKLWDTKNEQYKTRCLVKDKDRQKLNSDITERKKLLLSIYNDNKNIATSEQLEQFVDEHLNPEKYKKVKDDFFSIFELYLQKKKLSDIRENHYRVLIRALQRYELYCDKEIKKSEEGKPFQLEIDAVNSDTIEDFESFIRNEHTLCEEYPEIYKQLSITGAMRKPKAPKQRGGNTIVGLIRKFRAFYNWCNEQGITENRPFVKYNGNTTEKYGTPYYLTLEERNQIADFDLSDKPHLAVQRDIFIFQCLIGCRVSDLLKLTAANIINEIVEYIPIKTKDDRPTAVRVPLNERAKELVCKYKGIDQKGRLFPFISSQRYNDSIKDIFLLCGVTRSITVLNSITGAEEKKPINEIASSHIARRTFVGNLYKKVKDPNLVGSLSGHKEGSRAFARYREIDDDIKRELVNMIE